MQSSENSVAKQIRNFTIEAAAVITAAAPAFLVLVILAAAIAAGYTEYLFHQQTVGQFAIVSGGTYGAFRFSVGGAGIQMAKINRWIPCALFVGMSLAFTIWSSYHVDVAAAALMIGGTLEAAKIIILTLLWTAFSGELALGIFSYSMDVFRKEEEGNGGQGER